jgi:mono/diheme cytochrome c family protein
MHGRWPFRHGAALGIAILVLLAIAVTALLQRAADRHLPLGYAAEGENVFADGCARCHGDFGYGTALAPSLIETAYARPDFTRDDFADVIRNGSGLMPSFEELPAQDVADAVAFIRDIQTESGL